MPLAALPWTADTVREASKRELVAFFQQECSPEFLKKNKLSGQEKAIVKVSKLPALVLVYKDVLRNPAAAMPRSKLAIADAMYAACCVGSGTVAHILMRKPDYDVTKAEIQAVLEDIRAGLDFAVAAAKHSICPSARCGGLLGIFRQGEFHAAGSAEQLFPREAPRHKRTFGPVRTALGFQLIQVRIFVALQSSSGFAYFPRTFKEENVEFTPDFCIFNQNSRKLS